MSTIVMLFIGFIAAGSMMVGLWFIQRRTGDAGIVDAGWTFGVGGLAVFFTAASSQGDITRRLIIALIASAWAVRLGWHIVQRLRTHPEDGRYTALRVLWGPAAQRKLFSFYQFQAIACVLFAVPALIAGQNPAPFGIWDVLGLVIAIVAVVGEMIADRQLAAFRADSTQRSKVCQTGLWRYSRHPNYFFEWLHWWSYVCFAVTVPWGFLTVFAPFTMLYFILFVTGVPPTEAQALRSRGDAYRRYQQTTSVLIPWWPSECKANSTVAS